MTGCRRFSTLLSHNGPQAGEEPHTRQTWAPKWTSCMTGNNEDHFESVEAENCWAQTAKVGRPALSKVGGELKSGCWRNSRGPMRRTGSVATPAHSAGDVHERIRRHFATLSALTGSIVQQAGLLRCFRSADSTIFKQTLTACCPLGRVCGV